MAPWPTPLLHLWSDVTQKIICFQLRSQRKSARAVFPSTTTAGTLGRRKGLYNGKGRVFLKSHL